MIEEKQIIIKHDRIEWKGFSNVYEVIGFIEMHCNQELLKKTVVKMNDEIKKGA